MQFLIKLEDGAATGYPLLLSNVRQTDVTVGLINKDFLKPSDLIGTGYGVFTHTTPASNSDLTKQNSEVTATDQNSDGEWLQKFVLEDIVFDTPEAKQEVVAFMFTEEAASVRTERDALLADTDWSGNSDVTMASAMTTYRQALRDVPAQAGFPNTITWPTAP